MSKEADGDGLLPSSVVMHMVERPTADDLLFIVAVIAGNIALYNPNRLSKLYDYMQRVRRSHAFVPESKVYAMAECACALLTSFFANMEPLERMDKLVAEFKTDTMWQGVLRVLRDAGKDGITKSGINDAIKASMPGVVLDAMYLSNILTDFQNRELVEFFPRSGVEPETVFALKMLGTELCVGLDMDSPVCGACGRVL